MLLDLSEATVAVSKELLRLEQAYATSRDAATLNLLKTELSIDPQFSTRATFLCTFGLYRAFHYFLNSQYACQIIESQY